MNPHKLVSSILDEEVSSQSEEPTTPTALADALALREGWHRDRCTDPVDRRHLLRVLAEEVALRGVVVRDTLAAGKDPCGGDVARAMVAARLLAAAV